MADRLLPWYSATTTAALHDQAYKFSERLFNRQHPVRRTRAEYALFLYLGSCRVGLSGGAAPSVFEDEQIPFFNLTQAACDWFTSRMVLNQVKPFILTQKGDSEQQQKAEAAMHAVEAVMRDQEVYGEVGMLRAQDGHMFEGGGIKWAPDVEGGEVVGSRVRPWEVFYPEREARLGKPRHCLHVQSVERGEAEAMFPDAEEVWAATESETIDQAETVVGETSDMVRIYELWHLPSGKVDLSDEKVFGLGKEGKKPGHNGRHVIFTKAGLLLDEPWPFKYFPISWYLPWKDPVGPWSRSIPESLAGAQLELLDLGQKIQSIIRRHAVPHLLIWENAKINTREWTNDDAAIIKTRVPPQQAAYYLVPQSVPAELFVREEKVVRDAQKQLGLPDMALTGEKPKGLDHAPGMEHLSEETMQRHTRPFQAWERAHTQDAVMILDCIRLIAHHKKDYKVMFAGAKDLEEIDWKSMDLKRDKYIVTNQPTSLFAQTPTARFRQVEKFIAMYPEKKPVALKAFAIYPDADALFGDQDAEEKNIKKKLDKVVRGAPDEETMPHPYITPALAKYLCKQRINIEEANGNDEAVGKLSQWWDLVDEIEQQEAAKAAQLQAVATGATGGQMPGALPPGGAPQPMPPVAA